MSTPPTSGSHCHREDAGFTLIELIVALSIIAVGVFGTMQVFLGSLNTTASSDARTRATAIATREVESMRSLPYASVGFASTAPGFVPAVTEDGRSYPTVIVVEPIAQPDGADEVTRGVTYGIRRDIVWMPLGVVSTAFKRVIATVSWTDRAGRHEVRQDGGLYPGTVGAEGNSSATTTSTLVQMPPSGATALSATLNAISPSSAVDLAWTTGSVAPLRWEIQYSANAGASWVTVTTSQPAGTPAFELSGLSSATTYLFRVRGLNGGQASPWEQAAATTEQSGSASCTILSASVSPRPVKKTSTNTLHNDLVVSVNTSGACTGLVAEFPATTVFEVPMQQTGTTFTAIENKNAHQWSTGAGVIRVYTSNHAQLATVSLVVRN